MLKHAINIETKCISTVHAFNFTKKLALAAKKNVQEMERKAEAK